MPTILIACPEARVRARLLAAFEAAGWTVRAATSGAEALQIATSDSGIDIVAADKSLAANGLRATDKPVIRIEEGDSVAPQIVEFAALTVRLRQVEQEHDRAKAKLDFVLSAIGEMYLEVDRDWRILLASRTAEEYLRSVGRDSSGNVFDILPELQGTEQEKRAVAAMTTRRRDKFETASLLSDHWFEVELMPIPEGLAIRLCNITEAKVAEARYRASFELASIAKAQADPVTTRYVRVNRKMADLTGYSEAELLNMRLSDLTHPDDRPADEPFLREICTGTRNEYTIEKRYVRKTGEIIWVKVHVGVIRDAKGAAVMTTAVIEDITEAKRLHEQLLRTQHNLRRLAESNIVGFASANVHQVIDANDEFLRIIGRTRAELESGQIDWNALTPPEYAEIDRRGVEAILTTGICEPFEKEYIRGDGTRVPVLIGATRISDDPAWFAFIVDLTERKRVEAEREASRHRIEELLELAQVFIHKENAGIVFWSSAAEKMYGFSKDEALGRDPDDLLQTRFPDGKDSVLEALQRRGTWDGELVHTRRDGAAIVVASHWSRWRDDEAQPAILEIGNDVTERVRAEERLRAAQTGAGLGVWDWNLVTGQIYWSPEYRALYGVPEDFTPTFDRWLTLVDVADRERAGEAVSSAASHGTAMDIEFRTTRDGSTRWIRLIGNVSERHGDSPARMTGMAQDVTDIKAAQTELQRANTALQRSNEELRQFAYGVSHDLQEPLRTIMSFTQLLARRNEGKLDEQSAEFMNHVLGAADRMNFMIRDLLKYSSAVHQAPTMDAVNLDAVARWSLGNLRQRIEETGAEVVVDELPKVRGDFARLSQVMQNLIGNALKYRGPDSPRVRVSAERTGSEWTVCVADNGMGFAPEYAESIFGVFRRLHGRDIPGTGIGLAICRRIIEQHGGRIWAESSPGAGARFYFTVPAIE